MSESLKYPTVLAESGAGTAWTGLQNAAGTPGGTGATLGADGAAKQIDCTSASLAFTIPAGATINGIVVDPATAFVSESETIDFSAIVKKSGTTTETKTQTGLMGPPAVAGSSTDKWSANWTASDINSNLTVHVQFTMGVGARLLFTLGGVGITVYYTANGVRGRQYRERGGR